ncbi:hypothetical protein BG015_006409, partial [Linnemannia schmuckeri]
RGREAFSGGGITSASDSDSSKPPPRKQAPKHQGSNHNSHPTSIAAPQAKPDSNSAASPSAIAPTRTVEAAPSQEPAKAVKVTQLSSLGDTPKQETGPKQQETEQHPEQPESEQPSKQQKTQQPPKQQETEQQPKQQVLEQQPEQRPIQQFDPLGGIACGKEEEKNREPEHMDEDGEPSQKDDPEDAHMALTPTERQARKEARQKKAQATKQQIQDKVPKALAGRTDKSHRKSSTKTG